METSVRTVFACPGDGISPCGETAFTTVNQLSALGAVLSAAHMCRFCKKIYVFDGKGGWQAYQSITEVPVPRPQRPARPKRAKEGQS